MKKYALFVGVDMSKKWFDAALTFDGDKQKMIHKQFANTFKGFKSFLAWVNSYLTTLSVRSSCLICMEHTGLYTLPLCSFLEDQACDYVIESALQIKRSLGIRRGKSDKADSKDIAKYIFIHHKTLNVSKLQACQIMLIKSLLSYRARLVKQRVALRISTKEYREFTFDRYYSNTIIDSSEELIIELDKKIKAAEREIRGIIDKNEELKRLYDLISTIKGVGLIIGATLIVYTNGFKSFKSARKFASYIGIAPFPYSSGSSTNITPRISHLGYKKIKTLISNAVTTAIQNDRELKAYYHRKLEEGKNKFSVQNAVKNKIIQRVFAVVKRGTPYVDLHGYA